MKSQNHPLISVCIPVYNTEKYLQTCINSVINQDFDNFEIVVVSDCSKGKDQAGRSAKKIVKMVQKTTKVKITFIEHNQNRGILEVRRTAFNAATGQFITYLDSDDLMLQGALKALYKTATETGADIVHATSTGGTFTEDFTFTPSEQNRYGNIYYGTLENEQILKEWIVGKKFTANVWGKLISKDVYTKTFAQIPYTTCNLAEDFLMFFFIGFYAKKYVGIEDKIVLYREEGGMSSMKTIESLHKWKLICSSASVFSIIATWLEENKTETGEYPIDLEVLMQIKQATQVYLANNLMCFAHSVIDSIKTEAYQMLCDFWGEHFVKKTEKLLAEQTK